MNLPFSNIRQVLSLHNQVSPEKIFLTVITEKGREELSYAEFSARCHQTANFLQEDLGIQPGDLVTIFDDQPANGAVLIMACWLVGAVVAQGVTPQDERHIKAHFFRLQYDPLHESFSDIEEDEYYRGKPIIQLGGVPTEGYPHFDTLVRGMPNSFFNDYPEPTLESLAFQPLKRDIKSIVTVTQGELLTQAEKLAYSQAITGNQRFISCFPISGYLKPDIALEIVSIFITSLLVGGSLTICTIFEAQAFWREVAASRLHIACLSTDNIAQLMGYARQQQAAGKPIYGEGIYQQDIKQLRHIYCPDAKGHDDLIREFTAMFPFPIVTNS